MSDNFTPSGYQTQKMFGLNGIEFINDTNLHEFNNGCYAIKALSNVVLTRLEDNNNKIIGFESGITINAGDGFPVQFNTIQLTSGTIIAYKN